MAGRGAAQGRHVQHAYGPLPLLNLSRKGRGAGPAGRSEDAP